MKTSARNRRNPLTKNALREAQDAAKTISAIYAHKSSKSSVAIPQIAVNALSSSDDQTLIAKTHTLANGKLRKTIDPTKDGGTRNQPVTEALIERLEKQHQNAMARARAEMTKNALSQKWHWKTEGTPETHEKIDQIPTRRRQWPLHRMFQLGKITIDELADAEQIAAIIGMIEGDVTVRCSNLEMRVDNSGSAKDVLVETLGRIRMELAYRAWRNTIPKPAGMILTMITTNQSYVAVARRYKMDFKTARKLLLRCIRVWPEFRILARYEADTETVNEVYSRLGEGVLLAPLPRLREMKEASEL